MTRTLCALGAFALSSGALWSISTAWAEPSLEGVTVIGDVQPLHLGTKTVTATPLPSC